MKNLENQQSQLLDKKELVLDEKSQLFLTEVRKWTMFMAIIGFIFLGLLVIMGLIIAFVGSFFGSYLGGIERFLIFFVYIIIGGLYFFPIYYLLKFSVNMKRAIEQSEQKDLTIAFEYLKSHYKFIGILTIVVISLYLFIGIIAAIIGLSSIF